MKSFSDHPRSLLPLKYCAILVKFLITDLDMCFFVCSNNFILDRRLLFETSCFSLYYTIQRYHSILYMASKYLLRKWDVAKSTPIHVQKGSQVANSII